MAATTLRLIWPQWQGASSAAVRELVPDLPFEVARSGYATGTAVLGAILPPHRGPTELVRVDARGELPVVDGIEGKAVLMAQQDAALQAISRHRPDRIVTLGGDCSVSVAPFCALAERYADDLAVVWIDSHPDVSTGAGGDPGFNGMAVSTILGRGDRDVTALLPATVPIDRLALVGLHAGAAPALRDVAAWGLTAFAPDGLRESSGPLIDWIVGTGCRRVALHLDVDVVDSDEVLLGLGPDPGGLSGVQVRRLVADVRAAADVVGLTIAEYVPRQVLHLAAILDGFPLL
jgi:arginase